MAGKSWLVVLATICCVLIFIEAKPNRFKSSVVKEVDFGKCKKYEQEGKGDFSLEKKYYFSHSAGFYVASVSLLKRTSFYTCEPKEVKYGIDADGERWWVDKGCEAIFEVIECPESGNTLDMNSPVFQSELMKRTGMYQVADQERTINTEARFKSVEYVVV